MKKRFALPCGKVVPTCAAGGLRVRRDDLDAFLDEIAPVLKFFGLGNGAAYGSLSLLNRRPGAYWTS